MTEAEVKAIVEALVPELLRGTERRVTKFENTTSSLATKGSVEKLKERFEKLEERVEKVEPPPRLFGQVSYEDYVNYLNLED